MIRPRSENKIIAFDDLERLIIEPGFCTLCGACEAACPVHAIGVVDNKPNRLYDCSEYLDTCPICYNICPHTDALSYETLRFVAQAPFRRESLGHYRDITLAHAADPAIGDISRGGGVVNSLLMFAIKEGFIDSAIFSETVARPGIEVKPSISFAPDDMLSAVDVKIVPSAVAKAFGRAIFEYGKSHIAFVGVPCHITALRKLEVWQHKLMDSLEVTIGLFCLWTFSLRRLLEHFSRKYDIDAREIRGVELTMNNYILDTKGGFVRIPIPEVKSHIMNRCRTCMDFTSELADLSVGGASPLKGWSTVIIRTGKGEELFERAVEKGVLVTKDVESEPEVVAHVMQLSTFKKEIALQEIKEMERRHEKIPPASEVYKTPTTPLSRSLDEVKVGDVMTKEVVVLPPNLNVNAFFEEVAKHHHTGFPVMDSSNRVLGIVTLQDAFKVDKERREEVTVYEICTKELISVFVDESLRSAVEKMDEHDVGRLLVVDRNDEHLLLGILTRSDVVHALRKAT